MQKVLHGDCLELLKTLEDNSVDSIEREADYIEIIYRRLGEVLPYDQ